MDQEAVQQHWKRTKTVSEQIADQIAAKIVNGGYSGGERLPEQELAAFYGVSRGPIREAIRELEMRGLVDMFPRRGAFVVHLTVDAVADIFNVRATLMGLAVRYVTLDQDVEVLDQIRQNTDELERLSEQANVRPEEFVQVIWRLAAIVVLHCGNDHLARMLRNQLKHSVWGMLWGEEPRGEEPLDYTTVERRREVASAYKALFMAISGGRDKEAEALHRRILFRARDQTVAVIEKLRHQHVEARRLLYDHSSQE